MAISNIYKSEDRTIVTTISGGREHYPYRSPQAAVDTYEYQLSFGENYHTLASQVFQDDADWWVLFDLNRTENPFGVQAGQTVNLPSEMVSLDREKIRIV
jgi:hypothetical protein